MRNHSITVLMANLLLFTANTTAQQGGYTNFGNGTAAVKEETSIIRVLANPDSYDGQRVSLQGFFHFEFEDSAIYLHQLDSDQMLSQNAIWINLPKGLTREAVNKLNGHYVHCEGKFSAKNRGHMALFAGELSDVHWITISLSRAEMEKMAHGER